MYQASEKSQWMRTARPYQTNSPHRTLEALLKHLGNVYRERFNSDQVCAIYLLHPRDSELPTTSVPQATGYVEKDRCFQSQKATGKRCCVTVVGRKSFGIKDVFAVR